MRTRAIRTAGAAVGLSMLLAACGPLGSGDVEREERDVGEFHSVWVSDAFDVEILVDDSKEPSVVVNYDDNLIDQIVTEVRGGTLHIEAEGSMSSLGNARRIIEVVMPTLDELVVSGAVTIAVEGTQDRYDLEVSGASSADLRELIAEEVTADISGASNVVLHADDRLSGEVSGAASVEVYGEPASVEVDTSGASHLEIRD